MGWYGPRRPYGRYIGRTINGRRTKDKVKREDQWRANDRLIKAACHGDVAACVTLVRDQKLDPNCKWGMPLRMSVRGGHVDCTRALVELGADPAQCINWKQENAVMAHVIEHDRDDVLEAFLPALAPKLEHAALAQYCLQAARAASKNVSARLANMLYALGPYTPDSDATVPLACAGVWSQAADGADARECVVNVSPVLGNIANCISEWIGYGDVDRARKLLPLYTRVKGSPVETNELALILATGAALACERRLLNEIVPWVASLQDAFLYESVRSALMIKAIDLDHEEYIITLLNELRVVPDSDQMKTLEALASRRGATVKFKKAVDAIKLAVEIAG